MNATATAALGIVAEPIDAERCRLRADRPLLPERWVYVDHRADAGARTLADALLRLKGIRAVLIAHDKVTLTRETPAGTKGIRGGLRRLLGDDGSSVDSWREDASAAARLIRDWFASGAPAVSDALIARMPTAEALRDRVRLILERDVNPVVAGHGGGVAIHSVIDNVLYVTMSGGCQGCGLAENTLKHGVEAAIREAVPEIGEIIDLTDHKSGRTPYQGPALPRRSGS